MSPSPADRTASRSGVDNPFPADRTANRSGVHTLGPQVVGQRVVVRRRLPREHGQPGLSDVLGVCTHWGEGRCVLIRDDGAVVEIPLGDIVAGKPVPPRPPVRRRAPRERDLGSC